MWIEVCYHRMQIRVKLTCYKIGSSVGQWTSALRVGRRSRQPNRWSASLKRADIPAHTGRLTYRAKT
jgi:hypothetical protein